MSNYTLFTFFKYDSIKIIYTVFDDSRKENPNSKNWWAAYDEDFYDNVEKIYHNGGDFITRMEMVKLLVSYLQIKHSEVLSIDLDGKKAQEMREKIKENISLKSNIAESDCTEKKTYNFSFSQVEEFKTLNLSEKIKEFHQPFGIFSVYLNDDKDLNSTARYFGVMNVGILQKSSQENQFFWAFDLTTGDPIAGLEVFAKNISIPKRYAGHKGAKFDYFPTVGEKSGSRTKENSMQHLRIDNAKLLGKTNAEGVFQISQDKYENNLFIIQNKNYWGVHYSKWQESMNNISFPNAWSGWKNNKVVGILYTDRKIFRPSHTVNFKGFLREIDIPNKMGLSLLPANTSITAELRKEYPNGEIIKSVNVSVSKNSSFHGSFEIPENIELGDYSLTLVLPEKYKFNKSQLSAPIKIEEYKRPTFFVEAQSDKHEYFSGETATITVSSARYFGGNLDESVGEYTVYSAPYYPTDREDSDLDSHEEDSVRPAMRIQNRIIRENTVTRIDVKSKNYRLKTIGSKEIILTIFKENETCEVVKDFTRGERNDCTESDEEIYSETVQTNKNGDGNISYVFQQSGLYTIKAVGTGEHSIQQKVWVIPKSQSYGKDTDEHTNHNLSLVLDKDTYRVGEKAKLLINSPFPLSKAFISFESDSVFSSEVIDIIGNYNVYEFEVTEGMQPNINVGVFILNLKYNFDF